MCATGCTAKSRSYQPVCDVLCSPIFPPVTWHTPPPQVNTSIDPLQINRYSEQPIMGLQHLGRWTTHSQPANQPMAAAVTCSDLSLPEFCILLTMATRRFPLKMIAVVIISLPKWVVNVILVQLPCTTAVWSHWNCMWCYTCPTQPALNRKHDWSSSAAVLPVQT